MPLEEGLANDGLANCSIDDRARAFEADDQYDLIADPVCNPVDESWQRQRDVEKMLMEGGDGGVGVRASLFYASGSSA